MPFLWVMVVAYAALRFAGTREFELGPYLRAAFLWPVGELRPNVAWTLRHEALFYVLFAAGFLLRRRARFVLVLWCCAPILMWIFSVSGVIANPSNEFIEFLLKPVNVEFGTGVLLGLAYLRWGGALRRPSRAALPLLGVAAATALAFGIKTESSTLAVAVPSTLVVACAVVAPSSRNVLARFWEFLGDASYSIYLSHNLVLLVGASAWISVFGTDEYGMAVLVLGICSVGGGMACHLWVEKPTVRASRRLIASTRRRRVRALSAR